MDVVRVAHVPTTKTQPHAKWDNPDVMDGKKEEARVSVKFVQEAHTVYFPLRDVIRAQLGPLVPQVLIIQFCFRS